MYCSCLLCHGQTGPGGIEDTSGTSELILWLDANQIENIADQNNITTWNDASGYDHHATRTGALTKPNLYKNTLNGYPIVNFDGSDEYMTGIFSSALNAPTTLIAVGMFNQDQGTTESDYIFSVGAQNTEGRMFGIARNRDEDGNINRYYSYDGNEKRLGPVVDKNQWKLFTQFMSTSDPEHQLYIDGATATVDDYPTSLFSSNEFGVGIWSDHVGDGATLLNGQIAEIILFDKTLSTTEKNILESYLSAKYNLSIDASADKYNGDGTPGYDHDVIGIGGDPGTPNSSSVSVSKNGITLEQNSNFEDGDYILAGHNTGQNTINTTDITDDDTGAGSAVDLVSRWERDWWLDITDSDNNITLDITFDFSDGELGHSPSTTATDYKLIFRSDAMNDWTITTAVPTITGDQVIFSNLDIAALGGDGYYTLGSIDNASSLGTLRASAGDNGPGGIGSTDGTSNLKLWLNANDIQGETSDLILKFEDKSGNNNDASTSSDFPTLVTSSVNGLNTLAFNGNNQLIGGQISGGLSAPATAIVVPYFSKANQDLTNDYVISIGESQATNDHISVSRRNSSSNGGADINKYYSFDGRNPANASGVHLSDVGETISGTTWHIISQTQTQSAPRHAAYLNGTPLNVDDFGGDFSSNGDYLLGGWVIGANYFGGQIAEVVVFNKVLNSAELNIMHSYLGAKYDISVNNDKYDGDNDGASDPNYDLDVAGIGSESNDCSVGGAECNLSANSAGLKLTQNSGFETGDYVLAGHGLTSNSVTQSDIAVNSGSISERVARIWYFTVTDALTTASVDILFDISDAGLNSFPDGTASNYKILYRSLPTDDWDIIASASSRANDQIFFTGVSMSNGSGFYTVATINAGVSPLPVELVSFDANVLHTKVKLEWSTASELNNDRFIIERSKDGLSFKALASVAGNGTTNTSNSYSYIDNIPLNGTSYYRLKQVDYDGQFEYSNTIKIYKKAEELLLYPNPADNKIHYSGLDDVSRVYAVNVSGENLISLSFDSNSVDLSKLSQGIYILIFNAGDKNIHERIIINR